jgi:hypothetical protein
MTIVRNRANLWVSSLKPVPTIKIARVRKLDGENASRIKALARDSRRNKNEARIQKINLF